MHNKRIGNTEMSKKNTWQIKIYVGQFNKFVVCDLLPDDEEHAGLHEMLEFMAIDGSELSDKTKPGFYMAQLSLDSGISYDPEDDECFLVIDKVEPTGFAHKANHKTHYA